MQKTGHGLTRGWFFDTLVLYVRASSQAVTNPGTV